MNKTDKQAKQARLAKQLRANLLKRKQQLRARTGKSNAVNDESKSNSSN